MDTKALRHKILDLAIHGKLVPQNPNDEPASVLLQRIREEKERLIKEGKIKKGKKSTKTSDTGHYENVPFEVSGAWEWTTLGEIGDIVTGNTPPKDISEYYGGDIPFFKPTDLDQGIETSTSKDHLTELGYEQSRKLPAKSVLVTCIGATIGKTGLTTTGGTCNQQINAIIPHNAILSSFLYFVCISDYFQQEMKAKASATTLPILNKKNFTDISIPLPPLAEQHRIVAEIERWFSLIDTIESGKASLQVAVKQAKSKILDLAIHGKLVPQDPDDEPASQLLRRINPKAEIASDNAHYQKMPSEWAVCRLEDIVSYEQPTAYIVNSTSYDDTYPVPVLTAGKSFVIGRTNETDGVYSQLPCIIFDDFTTDSKLVDFPFKVKSSAMKILQVRENIDIEYIAMFMSITRLIGDTHKRYWISEYSKLEIPLPPLAEQRRIVSKIEELFAQLDRIEAEL